MNPAKKIAAGAAFVAVAAAAGLPAIAGYMLENSIKEQLAGTAEQYNYSVSSVAVNRSFAETKVDIALEGDNLRQLSRESLHITGILKHSTIFSLPTLAKGDFDYTYHIYQEGIRLALPGTVKGSINWQGDILAELITEGMELPLDATASATMTIHPITAAMVVTGDYGERKVQLDLDTLNWDIVEEDELLGAISLAPSKLAYSNKTRNWRLEAPSLSLRAADESEATSLSIADIKMVGHQYSEEGLIQSNIHLETGAFHIPELAHLNDGRLIDGVTLTSSIENVSQSSIKHLTELFQELSLSDNDELVVDLAKSFLVELTQHNPRFALDDITIKTVNGDISLAFHIASGEMVHSLVEELVELEFMTSEQQDAFMHLLVSGLDSSARITLSDDMLEWGCDRMGEQMAFNQGGSQLQAQMQAQLVGGMCKTLAKSGDFLNLACLQAPNPIYQQQCSSTVDEAKKVWVSDRTMELTLEEGKLMFNGAALELPVM